MLVASQRGRRWVYRTQADGRQRQATIGHYPAMTLAEAREKWATIRAEGFGTRTADTRSLTTLEALADAYADAQKAKGLRSWERVRRFLQRSLLARHADMTLGEVTREVLEDCYVHLIDERDPTRPAGRHMASRACARGTTRRASCQWCPVIGKLRQVRRPPRTSRRTCHRRRTCASCCRVSTA